MKPFKLNKDEAIIHNIINDTRGQPFDMTIEEVVHEIARLNYVKTVLNGRNFGAEVIKYRDRLLKHIEEV